MKQSRLVFLASAGGNRNRREWKSGERSRGEVPAAGHRRQREFRGRNEHGRDQRVGTGDISRSYGQRNAGILCGDRLRLGSYRAGVVLAD